MIGVFDSGMGGLTILQELRNALPTADFVYFGDTANVPYGNREPEAVRLLTLQGLTTLMSFQPDAVVMACNTATSQAIDAVRTRWPETPIIGVEPALKPAAELSQTKSVMLLATKSTADSKNTEMLRRTYLPEYRFTTAALPEWVEDIEAGSIDSPRLQQSVTQLVRRMREVRADVVVLGCTHFSFIRPLLELAWPNVTILDSGEAVARQTVSALSERQALPDAKVSGSVVYLSSGDPLEFGRVARKLLGTEIKAAQV